MFNSDLVRAENGMSWQSCEETAEAVIKSCHRTEMQSIMRFCMAIIGQISLQGCDDRNRASVELAKRIMQLTTASERTLPPI